MPKIDTALKSSRRRGGNGADVNRLDPSDRAAHDWYRFVLSYPPHLVRDYVEKFDLGKGACVLDPFCGTGTTLVECKKLGLGSVGIEAHPMSHFASVTKLDWSLNADRLEKTAVSVAEAALERLERQGIIDDPQPNLIREDPAPLRLLGLPADELKLLLTDSISPLPLHKSSILHYATYACFKMHFHRTPSLFCVRQ